MSSQSRPDSRPNQAIPELDSALRGVVEDFARHSRKNSEAIDVLVHALKAVHQDLQEEKLRSQMLEERLKETEGELARLAKVVDALRRQGWVQ
jgi:ferritin-like metal-binding protein YciE